MASLFGSSKVHILLVDADGVNLLLWTGRKLTQVGEFAPRPEDYDSFHVYFEGHSRVPCVIVTDFIEEDFRTELAVHVTGSDRTALLTRRLNLLFRNTPYRIARVIGREKTGRKDDRVLYTALTKPDIIEPWLSRLLKNRISVMGITSAAFVMELFAQMQGLKNSEHLLLVNQEAGTGLRQTYLQKGRVIFSRLTRTDELDDDSFSTFLREQCDQTRKYLERIKQLPYDARMEVDVFTVQRFTEEREASVEQLDFRYYAVEEMRKPARIELTAGLPGALAYGLAKALKKKGEIPNVYAPLMTRRYSLIRQISGYLYTASALVVACTLIFLSPTLFNISEQIDRETQMNMAAQPLLDEYNRLRETFPETPIQSGQMELVVSTYEAIVDQEMSPRRSLADISEALLASPSLILTGVQWDLEAAGDQTTEINAYGIAESEDMQFQRALVGKQMQVVTQVRGVVQSAGSFREARELITRFADALTRVTGSPVVEVSMPMDVSVNNQVSTVVDGRAAAGEFVLQYSEALGQ